MQQSQQSNIIPFGNISGVEPKYDLSEILSTSRNGKAQLNRILDVSEQLKDEITNYVRQMNNPNNDIFWVITKALTNLIFKKPCYDIVARNLEDPALFPNEEESGVYERIHHKESSLEMKTYITVLLSKIIETYTGVVEELGQQNGTYADTDGFTLWMCPSLIGSKVMHYRYRYNVAEGHPLFRLIQDEALKVSGETKLTGEEGDRRNWYLAQERLAKREVSDILYAIRPLLDRAITLYGHSKQMDQMEEN